MLSNMIDKMIRIFFEIWYRIVYQLPDRILLSSIEFDLRRPTFFRTLKKCLPLLSLFRNLELVETFFCSPSIWGSCAEDRDGRSDPDNGFWVILPSFELIKEDVEENVIDEEEEREGIEDMI